MVTCFRTRACGLNDCQVVTHTTGFYIKQKEKQSKGALMCQQNNERLESIGIDYNERLESIGID